MNRIISRAFLSLFFKPNVLFKKDDEWNRRNNNNNNSSRRYRESTSDGISQDDEYYYGPPPESNHTNSGSSSGNDNGRNKNEWKCLEVKKHSTFSYVYIFCVSQNVKIMTLSNARTKLDEL